MTRTTLDHSPDAAARRAALLARARRNGTVRPPIPASAPDTPNPLAEAREARAALLARAKAHGAFAPSRVIPLAPHVPTDGAPQDGAPLTRPRPAGPVTPSYQRRTIDRPHLDAAPFGPSGEAHDRPLPAGTRLPDACDPPPADKWGHASPRSHIVPDADGGYAVTLREYWPNAGLRTRRVILTDTNGAPVRVTPEQRRATHDALAVRSEFLATRRALALAESVTINLSRSRDNWRAAPCHFNSTGLPVTLAGAIVVAPVPTPVILNGILDDAAALAERLTTLDRASDAARKRRDRTRTTVQAAARRARDSDRRAKARAAETDEQRTARLAAQRERSARNRAAAKARA